MKKDPDKEFAREEIFRDQGTQCQLVGPCKKGERSLPFRYEKPTGRFIRAPAPVIGAVPSRRKNYSRGRNEKPQSSPQSDRLDREPAVQILIDYLPAVSLSRLQDQ